MRFFSKLPPVALHFTEILVFAVAYLLTRMQSLTLLPVFADEAIYIRWAQLIQEDSARYLFFSMADGKPPLFMWFLSIVLRPFLDPLFAARLGAAAIGFAFLLMMRSLASEFSKDWLTKGFAMLGVIVIPFWFFYHRMGLMDGLLSLFVGCSFLFALRLSRAVVKKGQPRTVILNALAMALSFGAAMMTKTPALFTIPILALCPFFVWIQEGSKNRKSLFSAVTIVGAAGFVGLLFFLLLRISPFFGALFSRSVDFTYSITELLAGAWKQILIHEIPKTISWVAYYMMPEFFFIASLGLWPKKTRLSVVFLFVCAGIFYLPLALLGHVLFSRYFLPTAIFLTIAFAVSTTVSLRHNVLRWICIPALVLGIIRCIFFIHASYTDVAKIPFVREDRYQYIEDWSAGFGNVELRDFILKKQSELPVDGSKKIIVLTEGSFGTLPDGLYMYFYDRGVKNVEIHGIGVKVPVVPIEYLAQIKTHDVYLVVNSHRFGILDGKLLLKEFEVARPDGQSLLVFKVVRKRE